MFLIVPATFRLGVFDLLLLDGTLLIGIGLASQGALGPALVLKDEHILRPGRCSKPNMAHELILTREKNPAHHLANMLIRVLTSTYLNKG